MRRERRPIALDEHRSTGSPFWSLTRWDHVAAVTADPATFTSIHGVSASNEPGEVHPATDTMIVFDPPVHTMARKLVNKGFTPRQVRALAPAVDRQVQRIVEDLRQRPVDSTGRAEIDFVADVAVRLPAAVICDMLGIPEADQQRMIDLTSQSLSPRLFGIRRQQLPAIVAEIHDYGLALAEERKANPTEDLTSLLVNGRIADEPLATEALAPFSACSCWPAMRPPATVFPRHGGVNRMAGGEATLDRRTGRTQGDEVGWIAAEEIVRWSSPVVHMKRNATWDTVLGSEESGLVLLQAFPDIEVCGPVSKSGSLFLNVVTNLPVRYTPT